MEPTHVIYISSSIDTPRDRMSLFVSGNEIDDEQEEAKFLRNNGVEIRYHFMYFCSAYEEEKVREAFVVKGNGDKYLLSTYMGNATKGELSNEGFVMGVIETWKRDIAECLKHSENYDYVQNIFRRLPTYKSNFLNDFGSMRDLTRAILEFREEGWSEEDIISWCSVTEYVNPDLSEEKALARMKKIAEKYKKDEP